MPGRSPKIPETVHHIPAGQHQVLKPQPGLRLNLLHSSSAYQVFLLQVDPRTDVAAAPHDGEELRFIISGKVVFRIGTQQVPASAGDSLHHPSNVPHGFYTEQSGATFVTYALSRDYDLRQLFGGLAEGEQNGASRTD